MAWLMPDPTFFRCAPYGDAGRTGHQPSKEPIVNLPIYSQVRAEVPAEWLCDDDIIEVDRGRIITADTPPGLDWVVAFTLGLFTIVAGIVIYLAAVPA